ARQAKRLPFAPALWRRLHRHQKPLICLRESRRNHAVGGFLLLLRLLDLMGSQFQRLFVRENRLPCKISANSFIQVLQTNLVNGQENQRVLEQSRSVTAHLQHCLRGGDRRVVGFL